MKKKKIIFFLALIVLVAATWFVFNRGKNSTVDSQSLLRESAAAESAAPTDRLEKIEISEGSTYGNLLAAAGVNNNLSLAIFQAAAPIYDLAKIRAGRTLDLWYDKDTDELKQLVYQLDTESELFVTQEQASSTASSTNWQAEIKPIDYEIKIRTAAGTIESSMYETAVAEGLDVRAIIELANAFQWSVDFAMDVQPGDSFKFIYEERYRDGEYVMPGQIFAGKFVNRNTAHYAFYFEENEDNQGFFDADGNSVQKMFLKAPLAYKYISSGYTTGPRYIAEFKAYTSSHMAIDYAAAIGTPVRAVGDGTVTFVGWDGGYGKKISIRHNATYSTNYAHLNGYAVKLGQKVKQDQTIGYVGSTGYSTGPHLHYEMVKNGVKVNPLREILPPGEAIKEENKERFFMETNQYKEQLDS